MPKVVDREEQRRQIGAALLRIVAEHGLDHVSVRVVAAESGRSAGAVQKYFQTKDQMLHFALELVGERVAERMRQIDTSGGWRAILRRLALATLPVDAERRTEATIWMIFAAHAIHAPDLAAVLREIDTSVRTDLMTWLRALRDEGRMGGDADPAALADALIAVTDGLALRMLYTPGREAELLPALDEALNALFPPGGTPEPGAPVGGDGGTRGESA